MTDKELVQICESLSNPQRLRLLKLMIRSQGPMTVSLIAQEAGFLIGTTSLYLKNLESSRLIKGIRTGSYKLFSPCLERIEEVEKTFKNNLEEVNLNLDKDSDYLSEEEESEDKDANDC